MGLRPGQAKGPYVGSSGGSGTGIVVNVPDSDPLVIDASAGDIFDITLTDDRSLDAPLNPADGKKIIFRVTQGGATGDYVLTWDAVFLFTDAFPAPAFSEGVGRRDLFAFIYNSENSSWEYVGERHDEAIPFEINPFMYMILTTEPPSVPAGYIALYVDQDNGNTLRLKDSAGNLFEVALNPV